MQRPASRMPRSARALTLVAAMLLGLLYVTPLWSVRLVAPQYPEGLGMYIRLNTVDGMKEHDLRNINSLNHYIGMKPISPDAIPELRFMPWIAAGLIATGLGVAIAGRRRLLVAWTTAFVLLGALGMADFYRWGHDYGHNLDAEEAIIVVPGMTYQPPLIGTKQLLNFRATSLPATGAIAGGVSMLLAGIALLLSYRGSGRRAAIATVAIAATACAGAPQLRFGEDACAECRMLISDRRFGAVLLTGTGKSLPFDSVECLLQYLQHSAGDQQGAWVVDAGSPGALLPVEQATFVRDGPARPPMGSLVAYESASDAAVNIAQGSTASWREIRTAGAAHAR
jgi:copper chaperone NosL